MRPHTEHPSTGEITITSATPKPRAGEHTPETDSRTIKRFTGEGKFLEEVIPAQYARHLEAERDLLRERERELVEALEAILRAEFGSGTFLPAGCESTYWGKARAVLAKHGR